MQVARLEEQDTAEAETKPTTIATSSRLFNEIFFMVLELGLQSNENAVHLRLYLIIGTSFCYLCFMYAALLKEKFPHDEANGLYVFPHLPGARLGRALVRNTRIASPNDIVALYLDSSVFGTYMVAFTADRCYHDAGDFLLEDLRDVKAEDDTLTATVNQKGNPVRHQIKTRTARSADVLRQVMEDIVNYNPKAAALLKDSEAQYAAFRPEEVQWLQLRDEVLRTIDLLYDRYNEGKLSLVEYEEKKAELLARL